MDPIPLHITRSYLDTDNQSKMGVLLASDTPQRSFRNGDLEKPLPAFIGLQKVGSRSDTVVT